ncbi:MAG: ImmA/IrrE family metallo-endopeptidase [bacterium]|nr:ImmA/IrrE family metallo-endopeptidase [bacterium]
MSINTTQIKFVNKNNLRIARENNGLNDLIVSKKITSSNRNLVYEWENGISLPTWSQVSKLSKLYDISELLFFSKETIKKNKQIPDYRVGQSIVNDDKIYKLINLVVKRQKWLERELKKEGVPKNSLQGKGSHIKLPKELAVFIKEKLNINLDEIKKFSGANSRKEVLNYLIKKAENFGIFVGKTISYHRIDVQDMRGLFISNDYCPYIVLNRRDALSAQIFSFIHELAHLFRKTDAISNSSDFRKVNNNINNEEIFCDKVAAELLLPENEFSKIFYDKSDIDNLSEIYKVSKLFIFYRLKDLDKIRKEDINKLEDEIRKETEKNIKSKNSKKSQGGNYTNNMKDSNGHLFNNFVSNFYAKNKIGYVEASNLLNCSVEKV